MIVYTCITNNKDNELPKIPIVEGCKYIYFSDKDYDNSDWERKELEYFNDDPRRIARWHKVNSHLLFPEEEYVLWVDGNISSTENPLLLLEELGEEYILSSKHPIRTCLYEEFLSVSEHKYDDEEVLKKQRNKYESEGMPKGLGLPETCVLLRRHCDDCVLFNESWWKEIKNHSKRDQLSFNYVAWKNNLGFKLFDKKGRYSAGPHSLPTTCST